MEWSPKRDAAFALISVERIHYHDFLTESDIGRQQYECAMGADRHRKRLLSKGLVIREFSANHDRHIRENSRATSLPGLCHRNLAFLATLLSHYG